MTRVSASADGANSLLQLGDAIREKRKLLGMSQEALADACGVERSHMGKIERGERNVTILNLLRISNALDCPLSELLKMAGL
ncbi:MAG TPA: helix-turn-helix transcriptional regulator [Limnobacter sp.]|nr:helix-turn-helix transcriptional regulator [Limnobacter sp.]